MTVNKSREVIAEERRHRVLQLKLAGLSLQAIAGQTGVGKTQVFNDLKRRLSELAQSDQEGANEMRSLQLARYESMLAPLWPLVIQLAVAGSEEQRTKGEDTVPSTIRWSVFKRDGYACVLCSKDSDLTIDHLLPQSKDGGDEEANLQTLCRSCNSVKGASGIANVVNVVRLNSLAFEQVMKILDRIDRICGVIPDKPLIGTLAINDNRQVNTFNVVFDDDDGRR